MNRIVDIICNRKIMVVLRNISEDDILGVARALSDGGIRMMEVTFDQSGHISDATTASMIKRVREMFGEEMLVGAGTVLTPQQVKMAKDGGASYVVSTDTNPDVIRKAVSLGLVSIPGAMTPTEIVQASRCGAELIKIFPSAALGTEYFQSIRKPLSGIKLMAFGGINLLNIRDFLQAGASSVGINTGIVDPLFVKNRDYKAIENRARAFVELVENMH